MMNYSKQLTNIETAKSVEEIIKSDAPVFQSLKAKGLKNELLAAITYYVKEFVMNNYPMTQNIASMSAEIANDLIELKSDWKPQDIRMFFQFIKQSQGDERFKIYGNSQMITPVKLLEFAAYYENDRAEAREKIHQNKKYQLSTYNETENPDEVKKHVDKIINKINFLKPIKSTPRINNCDWFDPVKNQKDKEILFTQIPEFTDEQLADIYKHYLNNSEALKGKDKESIDDIITELELEKAARLSRFSPQN